MRISKSTRTSVKAAKSFETIGLEPRQRTGADGKTWWVAYDTENQEYSTITQIGKYKTKKDCQYAIDKYKSYLSKLWGRDFADAEDVDACGDIKASVDSDIAKYKKSLESKAAKSGVYENFGAAEVRKLKDKYRTLPDDDVDYRTAEHNRSSIDSFEEWCMNYVGANTSTDKALKHIKAAIDILGTSGDKSDVTKDSIANLGVVMFDLQSKK